MEGNESGKKPSVLLFDGWKLSEVDHHPVEEFPLALTVNGEELATLIASPHDLNFLVAGFLRMQGLVGSVDDILAMSVCRESGAAFVTIRGEVPKRLKPTLTSGCGAGITFNLALPPPPADAREATRKVFTPADIYATVKELSRRAERHQANGGTHSAAVGDGRALLFHAEDIGRHNTLDRIAGEALFKSADLSGSILATSGRVSSEMVAKAAALGIVLIASLTSPTDMAVRMCEKQGITLVGYARGVRFSIYAHPWRIVSFFGRVRVRSVGLEAMSRFDPTFQSFRNINTPEEFYRFREGWSPVDAEGTCTPEARKEGA